MFTVLPN